jgi:hypothetical protein
LLPPGLVQSAGINAFRRRALGQWSWLHRRRPRRARQCARVQRFGFRSLESGRFPILTSIVM